MVVFVAFADVFVLPLRFPRASAVVYYRCVCLLCVAVASASVSFVLQLPLCSPMRLPSLRPLLLQVSCNCRCFLRRL